MPLGCVIYIPVTMPLTAIGVRLCIPVVTIGIVGCYIYTFDVGFLKLLVSTTMGNSQEPQDVKRATVQGFTLEPKYKTYHTDN